MQMAHDFHRGDFKQSDNFLQLYSITLKYIYKENDQGTKAYSLSGVSTVPASKQKTMQAGSHLDLF